MSPLEKFKLALDNPHTLETYQIKLNHIFKLMKIPGSSLEERADAFVKLADENEGVQWVREWLFAYISLEKKRIAEGKLRAGSFKSKWQTIKLFCEQNEDELGIEAMKWKPITRTLPQAKSYGDDKAITSKQIRKLIDNNRDPRVKPLVLVMCSSGIRVGAWEWLQWKHVEAIKNEKGEIVAAALTVYDDEEGIDKYTTFMTPEAFNALNAWMEFRKEHYEKIDGESWLMRDTWKMTEISLGGQRGVAQDPKKLTVRGIRKMLQRALRVQRVREKGLPPGKRRYEFKEFHSFRKFFYNQLTDAGLNPKNINKLMNHHIDFEPNYYKQWQDKVLQDYLKAVPYLTITDFEKSVLLQKVESLEAEKGGKLEQTSEQIKRMEKQIGFLMDHAFASEQEVHRWKRLEERIPPQELFKYMDKADMIDWDCDPEYAKFAAETSGKFGEEHEKYLDDVMAEGGLRLQEEFERWKKKEKEKKGGREEKRVRV